MYLNSVLGDLKRESAPPRSMHAEHLYKLNEAVFNLPEEDTVDPKMTSKLFKTLEEIRQLYRSGKTPATDANFFYDYLALLGTMQNQHFFSGKQTDKLISWIKETVDEGQSADEPKSKQGKSGGDLEAENKELRAKLAKLEKVQKSVGAIWDEEAPTKKKGKNKDTHDEPPPAKKGGKGKGKDDEPKGKGKGKGGKGKDDHDDVKGKGKGKGGKGEEPKGKGKGKGKKDDHYYDEPPPLRKGKGGGKTGKQDDFYDEGPKGKSKGGKGDVGKGKGKGKGKDYYDDEPKGKAKGKGKKSRDDYYDEPPPMRQTKGKGKDKGKEKGKAKGKGKGKY